MLTLDKFWEVIEKAWQASPELYEKRKQALQTNDEELSEALMDALEETVVENYSKELAKLTQQELTDFIHTLEERFYHIDRQDIHDHTGGSDDGFLYCRCFIIGMGKEYYNMIDATPSKAYDMEAEDFGFTAYEVYEQKFDEEFDRNSIHCIESCSNEAMWDDYA